MPQSDEKPVKKAALDLLAAVPKRRRAAVAPAAAPPVSAAPVKAAALPVKKVALDLLSPRKKTKAPAQVEATTAIVDATPIVEATPAASAELTALNTDADSNSTINIKAPITVAELAVVMKLKPFKLIAGLLPMGVFASPDTLLDSEQLATLCDMHGFTYERIKREKGAGVKAQIEEVKEPEAVAVEQEPEDKLQLRTPIITIMGHVDHGKTSLLDYIRNSRVVSQEAGGITQHIGAYTVEHEGQTLTFLDTPGHSIFTAMRARGADITDIVVIVVAANDGIMPQTREAIKHAKNAGKTIIIAVNKCDLESADPLRCRTQLMEEGLVATDFGGDIECVDISATKGTGISDLLELLTLQAEVLELKANTRANCRASIVEARMEQGKGCSATIIVQSGTLRVGMPFICGPFAGKIRTIINDRGERVKKVLPGMPAELSGFVQTPFVGDELVEMESEKAARKLADERQEELRHERLAAPKVSRLEDMLAFMGETKEKTILKLYLKGDVQGSVEAIKGAILDIKSDKVECVFVGASAGPITENDTLMASSSGAIILGFNVKLESNAVKSVKREGIQVKLYSIVYELIDQVRDAMLGLLAPETRETIIGHAEVREVFKLLQKGKAAGSYVADGKMNRKAEARVIRDGQVVFDGRMSTLRRFKDEVEEVKSGLECGIRLADYNEYEINDIIECYTLEKIKQSL